MTNVGEALCDERLTRMVLNASSNCFEERSDSVTTLYVASKMATSSPAHCPQKLKP